MTEPYFERGPAQLWHGDCIDVMRELPERSVDAIVTDPPYGIGFMGHQWDQPGDFGPIRAGGRPTPHARGRGKQVDLGRPDAMEAGRYDQSRAAHHVFQAWCEAWATEAFRVLKPGGHLLAFGGARTFHRLAAGIEDAGFEIRDSIVWLYGSGFPKSRNLDGDWRGWGTALKPAFEPIVVARAPMAGTVAANMAEHGTGALHIDACRIPTDDPLTGSGGPPLRFGGANGRPFHADAESRGTNRNDAGRWPANVVVDVDAANAVDAQSGQLVSGANPTKRSSDKFRTTYGEFKGQEVETPRRGVDVGGASRFFYAAKADAHERPVVDGVAHPTVKPLDLMQWLVRLVTAPGGTVLDPFAGSGTTAEAALREGFRCIAIEREESYLPLILKRLHRHHQVGLDLDGWEDAS